MKIFHVCVGEWTKEENYHRNKKYFSCLKIIKYETLDYYFVNMSNFLSVKDKLALIQSLMMYFHERTILIG